MEQKTPLDSWKWNLGWLAVAAFVGLAGFVIGLQKGRSDAAKGAAVAADQVRH